MTAREVKDALRRRHPAMREGMPGPWTTLEEYHNIDLLAFAAWSSPTPKVRGVARPIVGYEVKVARGDYRRELLRPDKRATAVARCHQFYLATPKDLLTKEEKAYVEPDHFEGQAFVRDPCPEGCARDRYHGSRSKKTGRTRPVPVIMGDRYCTLNHVYGEEGVWHLPKDEDEGKEPDEWERNRKRQDYVWEDCKTCDGRGYMRKSVVEEEAPTLWIPKDVGLIEIRGGKCFVVRKAPINHDPNDNWSIGQVVRYASFRGDPRHRETRVVN